MLVYSQAASGTLRCCKRFYSALKPAAPVIFNRRVKQIQRTWAANHPESHCVDYLRDAVASRITERLLDIKQRFSHIVDIGAGAGLILDHIDEDITERVTLCEGTKDMLHRQPIRTLPGVSIERRVLDDEQLDFKEDSVPCIISTGLTLHWTNDILGVLIQINRALTPDGAFLAAIIGGDTLFELRSSFQMVQMEREAGIMGSRVSPMTHTADVGDLLGRAGFVLTTVDVESIKVGYPCPWDILRDLRLMGETQALVNRLPALKKDELMAAAALYDGIYGEVKDDGDRFVPATFDIIYMIGWKRGPNEPKPLPRGSAIKSLKDLSQDPHVPTQSEASQGLRRSLE